ncbi:MULTISPECIES: copper resistance CopC/CopD family protein [unclassified Streptomyces]|uniref:copper resistance CopC/CopD family protein n=1 Tax=unclassified Streptomyces TaxID=2593676 RepID=UPI000F49337A|nr:MULTISPECIES: copper resistance protein CopC [unclassified Streptomyces]MCX4771203.1 copper resistance protein CopC [Streptomyces sp. NBC_01285]ROQ81454.1 copper transport protein [Streptomyces sp. CEV 2-1]
MTATAPHFGPPPSVSATRRPLAKAGLLAALVGVVFGLLLAVAGPASAHAALTGSDPQDGAVVDTAPKQVTLTFSEQVAVGEGSIRILDPNGKRADTEAAPLDLHSGSTVKYGVALHTGLPDGTYTVAWQAVSADSHPVSGAFTFSIGAPSETTVALPENEAGGGLVGTLYDIARYAAYAGFIVLAGGAAFVLACWQRGAGARPLQRLVVRGWMTLTAATLAMLLLRNPYTGSGKLADAFDLDGLKAVLDTKPGAALVSRLLLLGASALFIAVLFGAYAKREDEREKKDLTFGLAIGGAVIAAGIAGTWALAEHASTGIQPGIAMPVDVLHLLAVATWLGGLAALLVALYRTPDVTADAVRRFSRIAFGSVLVVAATGIYQSWRQLGSWSALTGTGYGQLLLVKVGLVAVLVGVASVSRRWTARLAAGGVAVAAPKAETEAAAEAGTPAAEAAPDPEPDLMSQDPASQDATSQDPARAVQLARQKAAVATAERKRVRDADPDRSGLRRSVLAEVGVAVALLAVTTILTSTEPGRTEEEAARASSAAAAPAASDPVNLTLPFDTGGENGKGTVRVDIDPGRTGTNVLHLWIEDVNGKAMDVPEVKVALTLKSKDIGPLPVVPVRLAEGHWTSTGVQIPIAGNWNVSATVRTSDIDQTTVDKNVKIG